MNECNLPYEVRRVGDELNKWECKGNVINFSKRIQSLSDKMCLCVRKLKMKLLLFSIKTKQRVAHTQTIYLFVSVLAKAETAYSHVHLHNMRADDDLFNLIQT